MRGWRIHALPNSNNVTPAIWKNRSKLVALCVAMPLLNTLLASRLSAQTSDATASASPKVTRPARRRPTLDDRVKALAKALDLSETQQASVKKILEERQQETLRLRTDASIPASERIDRFRALQDQTVQRIRAVLNDEQKKRYDPLVVRQVGPAPDQRSVEDWIKATTPK
jgi:hypothetical protein